MKQRNNKKGFTLIELLVVITIIGILATSGVTVYTSRITQTRDSKRITDLESVNGALLQYMTDKGVYPEAEATLQVNPSSHNLKPGIYDFLRNPVEDPNNLKNSCNGSGGAIVCGYVYSVGQDSVTGVPNGGYELATAFESKKSREEHSVKDGGSDTERYEISNGNQKDMQFTLTGTTANKQGSKTKGSVVLKKAP